MQINVFGFFFWFSINWFDFLFVLSPFLLVWCFAHHQLQYKCDTKLHCLRKTSLANRIHYNEADTEDISLKTTRRLPLKWLTETFAQEKSFIRTFTHRLSNQKIHRFDGISYNFHWFAIKIDSFALHSSLNRLIFNIFAFSMGFDFFSPSLTGLSAPFYTQTQQQRTQFGFRKRVLNHWTSDLYAQHIQP